MLVKFDENGFRKWATYYGGTKYDYFHNCIVDNKGSIYIVGESESSTNIATSGSFQNTFNGSVGNYGNAILIKFDSLGARKWGTYYGESSGFNACKIDNSDNVYVVGTIVKISNDYSFIGHQNTYGDTVLSVGTFTDAILVKFDNNGIRIWATYYGGKFGEVGSDCSLDTYGNIYMCGSSSSNNNIAFNGFQMTPTNNINSSSNFDAYIVKFNPSGVRQWATYYGDSFVNDFSIYCTNDKLGNVFLSSRNTKSLTNITTPFLGLNSNGKGRGNCLVKFDSLGNRLWARFCSDTNLIQSPTTFGAYTDDSNNVFLYGWMRCNASTITANGFQKNCSVNNDGYLAKYSNDGNLVWGSYFGSTGTFESINSISINSKYKIFISGYSNSTDISLLGFQNTYGGGNRDGFLAKLCSIFDTPKIRIVATTSTSTCAGGILNFIVIDTFEGIGPHYVWKKNGTIVGTDTPFYTIGSLSHLDKIQCFLTSSASCLVYDTASSNAITITIKTADTAHIYDTICSNQTYPFNSQTLATSGLYKDTFISNAGCDSFIFLHLLVKPTSLNPFTYTTNCSSPSYFFKGQTRTQSGVYLDTPKNIHGCDSFVILNLIVRSANSFSFTHKICPNTTYLFNGNKYFKPRQLFGLKNKFYGV